MRINCNLAVGSRSREWLGKRVRFICNFTRTLKFVNGIQ